MNIKKIALEKVGADSSNKSGRCEKSYTIVLHNATTIILSFGKIGRAKNEQYVKATDPEKAAYQKLSAKLNDGYKVVLGKDIADALIAKYSRFRDFPAVPTEQTTLELA